MNDTKQNPTQALTVAEKARGIDKIASEAMALYDGATSIESALAVGECIKQMRAALTSEIMQPILALANTDLGFLTDKDPKRPSFNKKSGRYEETQPYSVDVIRDVLIESSLRGFRPVGNEFNVISGRFYAAKNGLKRRCETWPGVVNLKIIIGVPHMKEGGAIATVMATWKKDGAADKIETEIAIRVNEYMGADAIVGKAERKLYKRIFDRLSGRVTPEGEVDDVKELLPAESPKLGPAPATTQVASTTVPTPPRKGPTLVESPLTEDEKAEEDAGLAPEQSKGGSTLTSPADPAGSTKAAAAPTTGAAASPSGPAEITAEQAKCADLVSGAGCTFEDFRKYAMGAGWEADWDSIGGWPEVPAEIAHMFVAARRATVKALQESKARLL